jgi:hypothetical protein
VATEGVPEDVAAVSAAVNSTVHRLAAGVGGQVDTILLASIASVLVYPISYGIAGTLCLAGAALTLLGQSASGRSR